MTIGQFGAVIVRNGFFGSGAGTGAQGAQYFGGGADVVGFAAEGGLGRVLAELGVPGLAALAWFAFAMGRVLLRIARGVRQLPLRLAAPAYGLVALLPANLAVFVTAHQVYGDPFVLIVLGWLSGAALAVPKMVRSEVEMKPGSVAAPHAVPTAAADRPRGRWMRILHVVPSYLPAWRYGGPIRSVHGLAKAQVRAGDEVEVFTTDADGAGRLDVPTGGPVEIDGVRVNYFRRSRPRRLYRSRAMGEALRRRLREFDVAHLHSAFLWPTQAAARAAAAARVRYFVSPRGMLVQSLIAETGEAPQATLDTLG